MVAFLAWFGGTGYLLTEYSALWFLTALGASVASGVTGAALVFWFLAKLVAHEQPLDPADYRMVGVLGRVSSRIRPGGTGEMIFSQEGARRSAAVRSEDGSDIPKNTEVVVTRYEKGIGYVRRWTELTGVEIDARHELRPSDLSRTGLRELHKLLSDLNLRVSAVALDSPCGPPALRSFAS